MNEQNQYVNNVPPVAPNFAPANTKKTPMIAIIAAIAVVLAIVIAIIAASSTPASVAKKYMKATITADMKKADSLRLLGGKAYYEYRAEEEDKDLDEYFEDRSDDEADSYNSYMKYMQDEFKDQLEDEFGDHIKIEFKNVTSKKLSNKKVKDIRKQYEDSDFIDSDKISAAYKVKIRYRVKGSDKSESDRVEFNVVKYRGKLKVIDY